MLDRLFNPFDRLGAEGIAEVEGTGLGLSAFQAARGAHGRRAARLQQGRCGHGFLDRALALTENPNSGLRTRRRRRERPARPGSRTAPRFPRALHRGTIWPTSPLWKNDLRRFDPAWSCLSSRGRNPGSSRALAVLPALILLDMQICPISTATRCCAWLKSDPRAPPTSRSSWSAPTPRPATSRRCSPPARAITSPSRSMWISFLTVVESTLRPERSLTHAHFSHRLQRRAHPARGRDQQPNSRSARGASSTTPATRNCAAPATRARKVVGLLQEFSPDLIVLDLQYAASRSMASPSWRWSARASRRRNISHPHLHRGRARRAKPANRALSSVARRISSTSRSRKWRRTVLRIRNLLSARALHPRARKSATLRLEAHQPRTRRGTRNFRAPAPQHPPAQHRRSPPPDTRHDRRQLRRRHRALRRSRRLHRHLRRARARDAGPLAERSSFPRLTPSPSKYGLEKIKTIGDAYMRGRPLCPLRAPIMPKPWPTWRSPCKPRSHRLAHAAGDPLQIRVGIHTGQRRRRSHRPRRKFAYDLWGDTVNTASRMQTHGLPGAIQVSATVCEAPARLAHLCRARRGGGEREGLHGHLLANRAEDLNLTQRARRTQRLAEWKEGQEQAALSHNPVPSHRRRQKK